MHLKGKNTEIIPQSFVLVFSLQVSWWLLERFHVTHSYQFSSLSWNIESWFLATSHGIQQKYKISGWIIQKCC